MSAVAVIVYAGEPVAVAVMVQLDAVAGLLKTPALSIEPHVALQFTAWLPEKLWVLRACRFTAEGVIVIGELTVTLVEAVVPLPSVAEAVTWQVPGSSGAVYNPLLALIDPQSAANVAGTLVVNCWVAFSVMTGVSGDKVNCAVVPMVSCAVALFAGPDVAVAVMVQTDPAAAEAVKRPAALMPPQLAVHVTG